MDCGKYEYRKGGEKNLKKFFTFRKVGFQIIDYWENLT